MTRGVSWRAAKDGIAHALVKPNALNAACGRRAVLERLAWPATSKCLTCRKVLGEPVEVAAA